MAARPDDYASTARALAQSTSSTPSSPTPGRPPLTPRWSRPSSQQSHMRNTSNGLSRGRTKTWEQMAIKTYWRINKLIRQMPLWQQLLGVFLGIASLVGVVLFLVYGEKILSWVASIASKWQSLPAGWLICWALTFIAAFPPMIGYSSTITLAGIVYGFPNGWFIVATSTVVGSFVAFLTSRTILSGYVHRLIGSDKRFRALALTLKHDGLKILVLVRLCPLPYSLSNGALSTVPTLNPWAFALATALATPRLMIHAFIGSRLRSIIDSGEKMDRKTKIINYASIFGGIIVGTATGWLIYQRTIARAKQLEEEERQAGRLSPSAVAQPGDTFTDELEEEHVAATLLGDDEIAALEGGNDDDAYTDDFSDGEPRYSDRHRDEEQSIGLDPKRKKSGRR